MSRYRYSRWDGSQRVFELDEDSLLEELSDDILADGDVERALRNLLQRGLPPDHSEERIEGLHDLMERLKQQRQRQLERYNLDSVMDDLKERLQDVVDTERRGIDGRLEEARQRMTEAGEGAQDLEGPMRVLEERAQRSRHTLDSLPDSPGGAIRELAQYDFMDPEARQKLEELLDILKQRMMESVFQGMRDQVQGLSPEQMNDLKKMVRALNNMLRDRSMGLEPDFQGFMEQFGHYFDPDRPASLDELVDMLQRQMAAMQSMMNSMSPEMRGELESMLESAMDDGLMGELAELASQMYDMYPIDDHAREHPFMGPDSLTLDQAMELMGRLQDMDELERQVRQAMRGGKLESIDPGMVEEHLGEDGRRLLEKLQEVVRQLQEAGYLRRESERLELTPRGLRKLGQQALKEVFSALKKDRIGRHEVYQRGEGGEHTGETKPYEYGDPMDIHLQRTLFNGIVRHGPVTPVRITPADMEVHRTEHLTQAATVLLLDQSRSMGMFGSFLAAKKVAIALHSLITSRFHRDSFHIIGFSDYAMEVKGEDLPELTWNDWGPGTNMHHAFMLSRKLLAKEKASTKQVLMITDGEPTAHLKGPHAYFSYPPSYTTLDETLKEVKRCTQSGITINTFMLATNHYLVGFVDRMTRINRGRAFYSTPGQLGSYVVVDYLRSARKRVS